MTNRPNQVELDLGQVSPVRLVKPALFVARKRWENGKEVETAKPNYEGMFVLTSQEDTTAVWNAILSALQQPGFSHLLGQDGRPTCKHPLHLGDDFAAEAPGSEWRQTLRGKVFMNAHSGLLAQKTGATRLPPVLQVLSGAGWDTVPVGGDKLYASETQAKYAGSFYGGVECGVTIVIAPFDVGGNKGVTAYLNLVASLNRGERVPAWCNDDAPRPDATTKFSGHLGTVQPEGSPYAPAGFAPPPGAGGFAGVRY